MIEPCRPRGHVRGWARPDELLHGGLVLGGEHHVPVPVKGPSEDVEGLEGLGGDLQAGGWRPRLDLDPKP